MELSAVNRMSQGLVFPQEMRLAYILIKLQRAQARREGFIGALLLSAGK
jgi:hypothetical protein